MFTQRVYALFLSKVSDELLEPFKKIGAVTDWGLLTNEPMVNYIEFNALAFEPEAKSALEYLSKQEKILFFWAYNDDLDMDVESAGMHKDFAYSWGFKLLDNGQNISSVVMNDNWPSYGEALQKKIDESISLFTSSAFAGFLHLNQEQTKQLDDLFNKDTLFEKIDEGDLDQFMVRDRFLDLIKVDIR